LSNKSLPPEPDPFDTGEFVAWRGLLRLRETVMRELDRRLTAEHNLPVAHYGVLITLISAPDQRLRMGELAQQRMLTPSGITRIATILEKERLLTRQADPADRRSFYARLTLTGVRRLRSAQVTHHRVVRELYLDRLTNEERLTLGRIFEKAHPGVVSHDAWPPSP